MDIDLVCDGQPNAYTYKLADLVSGYKIFNKWFQAILDLKKAYPKNILTKMLSSSLWGHLTRKNIIYRDEKQAEDMKIGLSYNDDNCDHYILEFNDNYDGSEGYYKLHVLDKQYRYQLRIKAFLTAYARNKMSNIIEPHFENVIRVHTDGVCFNKPMDDLNIPNFIAEAKTTGLFKFPIRRTNTDYDSDNEEEEEEI